MKYLIILLIIISMSSCYDAGTKIEYNNKSPYVSKYGDTVDFDYFYPVSGVGVWVGTSRKNNTISLSNSSGEDDNTYTIILNNSLKIKGNIVLENDDIVIIQKVK
jgi:hypothetical protein